MRVVVVGAGLSGLSATCHLAGRGHEVVVLERASTPGGLVGAIEGCGYRLATGATVLTMPEILEQTFAAAGSSIDDHLHLQRLDPIYRATFGEAGEILVRADHDAMIEEIAAACGRREADAFVRFVPWLTELYELEMPHFIARNFDSPLDLLRRPAALLRLVRLGGFRRLNGRVASFFRDDRLQRLFSFQSLYAGLSPFSALSIYAVITYMDTVGGVFWPTGGVAEVGRALAAAAMKAGAEVECGVEAESIDRSPAGAVAGVRSTAGEFHRADAVVLTGELTWMYRRLLGDQRPPRGVRRGERSPSCLVWSAGISRTPPHGVAHHNIHFGREWRESFESLLAGGTRMDDPSLLVTCASVTDPTVAPAGTTALFALEPVPNLDGRVDWDDEGEAARERLLARLQALDYPTEPVDIELWRGPREWEALSLERGTPFGLSHRFSQTGPFRPSNVERRVPGVYFAGASTVPGVGIPMVLISGRLAAERVEGGS